MFRILIMAIIFSVEIFSAVAFANPRVAIFNVETPQALVGVNVDEHVADFVTECLHKSGKFHIFDFSYPEELGFEVPDMDYHVFSQLITVPANRANTNRLEMRHRLFLVRVSNGSVVWSAESVKTFDVSKVTIDDLFDAGRELPRKVVKRLVKDIDSGKLVLK